MPSVRSKEDPPGIVSSQQIVNGRCWPTPALHLDVYSQAGDDPMRPFIHSPNIHESGTKGDAEASEMQTDDN